MVKLIFLQKDKIIKGNKILNILIVINLFLLNAWSTLGVLTVILS